MKNAAARLTSVIALVMLVTAGSLGAQRTSQPAPTATAQTREAFALRPSTYGPSAETSYVIGSWDFDVWSFDGKLVGETGGGRSFSGPTSSAQATAAVHLPNGARLSFLEVQGCDNSATGYLTVGLYSEAPTPAGGVDSMFHGQVSTSIAGTPGCNYFGASLNPDTVDNYNRTYFVHLGSHIENSSVRFTAVRVFYNLQVSPAPGGATFADVPVGHPFHRFVEALATSGITGGCGGGNYCPDAPLTRGQMAVFLAVALGLHWPN